MLLTWLLRDLVGGTDPKPLCEILDVSAIVNQRIPEMERRNQRDIRSGPRY
jgi:hypothetical protein